MNGIKPNRFTNKMYLALPEINNLFSGIRGGYSGSMQDLKTLIEALGGQGIFIKGSVASYSNLPSDATKGDGYFTLDTGHLWVWSSTAWEDLGNLINLSQYAKIDGYYSQMGVGTADNITSRGTPVGAEFTFRPTGGTADIADGNATVKKIKGKKIVSILSGGNMDVITMSSVVQQGLIMRNRIFTVAVLGTGLYIYLIKSSREQSSEDHLLMAVWTMWTVIIFLPAMHERYTFPLDVMLIILCVLNRKYIVIAASEILISLMTYGFYLFGNGVQSITMSVINLGLYAVLSYAFFKNVISQKTDAVPAVSEK